VRPRQVFLCRSVGAGSFACVGCCLAGLFVARGWFSSRGRLVSVRRGTDDGLALRFFIRTKLVFFDLPRFCDHRVLKPYY
jgi:hypothetical protein